MIKLLGDIPRKVSIAYSGGIDSVAVTHFLSRNHEVELLYFDHHTMDAFNNFTEEQVENYKKYNDHMESYIEYFSNKNNIKFSIGRTKRAKFKGESLEEYWRNIRYEWFHSMEDKFIVTGHHLNDCVETWLFTSMHGNPRTIPYKNKNVYRPFLLSKKSEFERIIDKNNLSYYNDPSNDDINRMRNYIRKEIVPHAMKVNPGIFTTVKNKIVETESQNLYHNETKMLTI